MSNTYARIETRDVHKEVEPFRGYTNDMNLSLTAFMGGKSGKHTQLTVNTQSTLEHQNGTAYITLGDKEVDLLIAALMERKLKVISATGDEQSIFCPDNDYKEGYKLVVFPDVQQYMEEDWFRTESFLAESMEEESHVDSAYFIPLKYIKK